MAAKDINGAQQPVTIDVVICTYNRASDLDRILAGLAGQEVPENLRWSVLVVDNASTDHTRAVVNAWSQRGAFPRLRYHQEPVQGLSHARATGFRETTGAWIAYVDDDNLLAPDWLAELTEAVAAKPDAGGIGGRVIIDSPGPRRPYLDKLGWCFAEQDHGAEMCEIDNLVGAGMVLRRQALDDCGWPDCMLLQDRTGAKLVSGGDAEMVQRVRLAGHRLWYAPGCILKHRIAPDRMTRSHVCRLSFGLGKGAAQVDAACSDLDKIAWQQQASRTTLDHARYALNLVGKALVRREDITVAIAQAAFAAGFWVGTRLVNRGSAADRATLVGAARSQTSNTHSR